MHQPDLILENANIQTMDPACASACSVALAGSRIHSLSSDPGHRIPAPPGTRRIDLEGRLVLPGFFDSHFHYYQWAMGRTALCLEKAVSFRHCMEMIHDSCLAAPKNKELTWIQGQGFNESDWPENRTPTRHDLDLVCPDLPVLIWRCDLHLAVANTKALEISRLFQHSPDYLQGLLERDEHGSLTGVLREEGINAVKKHAPEPDLRLARTIMEKAQSALHALGITAVHDVRLSGNQSEAALTFRSWQSLRQKDRLRLRCWTSIPGEDRHLAESMGLRTGFGDEYLRVGHLKYFMDGGMGARTAWMLDPYADTRTTGLCLIPREEMLEEVIKADQAGLAVMVHAIGDRAARELVSVFEQSRTYRLPGSVPPAMSHRLEHIQVIRPRDLQQLSRLGMPASVQPANMLLDINMIDRCAGQAGRYAYNFRSMLDAGLPVMFSSDCPVCDPNPLTGIQAAVTRTRNNGTPRGGWNPDQRVSLIQALAAYTSTPARVYRVWSELGSITPGKLADLIVFRDSPFEADPLFIHACRVDMTIFNGKIVYELT
ncbi:MAG: amidohydrolase [Desulfonatronovibrionaceae bacterium]